MRFAIDSDVIAKDNITIQEFSVLLYYIAGGVGILNESLCSSLWNKGFLVKDVEGYICDVDMDEDDYARMRSSDYSTCPYYRNNDDYLIVRKQI